MAKAKYQDLEQSCQTEAQSTWSKALGVLYCFIGSITHGVNVYLNRTFELNYLVAVTPRLVAMGLIGTLGVALQSLPWTWSSLGEDGHFIPGIVLLSGLLNGLAANLGYAAVFFVPLGDVIVIMFSTPLFSFVFCYLILGQRVEWIQIPVGCLILLGELVVMWTQIELPSSYSMGSVLVGSSLALVWAMLNALQGTIITGFLRDIPPSVMLLYTGLPSALAMVWTYPWQSKDVIFLWNQLEHNSLTVAGMSFNALVRYFFIMKSLHLIDANTVGLLRCVEIVVDYSLQVFVLNEPIHALELSGAGLVLGSIALLAIQQSNKS